MVDPSTWQLRLRKAYASIRRSFTPPASGPVYVFHHIPKTGGSSIKRVLPYWFYRISDNRVRVDPDDWTAGHRPGPPIDLSRLRRNDCLAGHWAVPGEYIHERYPEVISDPRYRLFAFVRHPLQTKLSLYSWEQKRGKDMQGRPIEDELLTRPNYLAERFPCTEDDYEEVLSRYFFIGITEDLQTSFDRLADELGRSRVRLPHVNRSRTEKDPISLSPEFLEEFERVNRLDYALYDHCVRRATESR